MFTKYSRIDLTDLARDNRLGATKAERVVWFLVRNKKMGYRFRRQHQIGKYIVDFFCSEKNLIIECDGGQHDEGKPKDDVRTKFLESKGYKVIRLWNNEVLGNAEGVYTVIMLALK